jgi:Rieske Fe-S protein
MTAEADGANGPECDRRSFLSGSTLLMAGGLAAGYGTFFAMAGRYLYPSSRNKAWLFVANASSFTLGESRPFVSPTGVAVTITCQSKKPEAVKPEAVNPEAAKAQAQSASDDSTSKGVSTALAGIDELSNSGFVPGFVPGFVADFVALSSICPHLGCRVHWESHNERFFCPCHNGAFDSSGKAIAGPPKTANQTLPEYPLKVVDGSLYIEMSIESVRKL